MKERRYGKFYIDTRVIDFYPEIARAILQDVIVMRAEHRLEYQAVKYSGEHPDFLPVAPFVETPYVMPQVTADPRSSDDVRDKEPFKNITVVWKNNPDSFKHHFRPEDIIIRELA